ncbi:MAG: hypothetical protein NVS3B6_08740 [Pseudarthrobacter sp.]
MHDLKEHGGIGFAAKPQLGGSGSTHHQVEGAGEACSSQNSGCVPARGCHGHGDPGCAQPFDQGHGSWKGADTIASQQFIEEPVLAPGQAAHCEFTRGVARLAVRQRDTAGGQERPHAVFARPAIDVVQIISGGEWACPGLPGKPRVFQNLIE